MTTIGIIGAGHIGSQIARLAVESGYNVVISNSRGPETCPRSSQSLVQKRAQRLCRGGKGWRHCRRYGAAEELPEVPVEPLAGKIVIDTNNYYPDRDGHIPDSTTSRPPRRNFCRRICQPRRSSRPSTTFLPLPLLRTDSRPARRIVARWSSLVTTKMPRL